MMNAEEYLVERVKKLEIETESQQKDIQILQEENQKLSNALQILAEHASVDAEYTYPSIDFDRFWRRTNIREFDLLIDVLGLTFEESKDAENE